MKPSRPRSPRVPIGIESCVPTVRGPRSSSCMRVAHPHPVQRAGETSNWVLFLASFSFGAALLPTLTGYGFTVEYLY